MISLADYGSVHILALGMDPVARNYVVVMGEAPQLFI